MRNSDPIFFPGTSYDLSLRQQMERNYQDSIANLQVQWQEADMDQRSFLGDPDIWNILFPLGASRRRKMFTFNIIHAMVQSTSGRQRQNRKSTIAIPVHNEAQKTSDQLTKCLYHVDDKSGFNLILSDAFEQGALVQGFGLIGFYPDFTTDPVSPDIKCRYIDMKSVLMDAYFRQKDLSDCRFIWTRQYMAKDEAKRFYSKFAEEIDNVPTGNPPRDDKFYYMPENIGLTTYNLIAFDEYWYQSTREAYFAVDSLTEESTMIDGDEEDIRLIKSSMGDQIQIVKKWIPTVRRAILVNSVCMVDEVRPWGLDRYPFAGVYGNFNPDTMYFNYKFKGQVRDVRDAQYLFNLRKVCDLDILSSQQQGLKVKKGALLQPDDSLNAGNGRVLVINETNQMTDVEPMQIIPPSPVMLQMEDMLKGVMREIVGINEETVGAATNDVAGVLSALRQNAGLMTQQKYFDQLDETQKICGDIKICMIQNLWSYGKVKKVIGEEPTSEFDDKAFFKYSAKVVPGVLTETQQQLELAQIFELQQRFGDIFPFDEVIECMTIQNKDRIVEKMQKAQEQKQQQQQQAFQLQMQQMQVDNQTKMAYSQSQESLAQERIAKIQTDQATAIEKIRRSKTDEIESILSFIKTIKELQGMDLEQIRSGIEMIGMVEPKVEEEKAEQILQQ